MADPVRDNLQFRMQRSCATDFGESLSYWFKIYFSSILSTNAKKTAIEGQTKRRDLHIRRFSFIL
jgi:hypothetical protein